MFFSQYQRTFTLTSHVATFNLVCWKPAQVGHASSDVDGSADNDDDDDDNNDNDRRAFQDINRGWPVEAHYTPIRRDARNLSIMKQPQPMKKMIRAAVNQVTEHFLFDSAYPGAAEQVEFETFHRDVFIQCSKCLKYFEIIKRLKVDGELVKLCARVVQSLII